MLSHVAPGSMGEAVADAAGVPAISGKPVHLPLPAPVFICLCTSSDCRSGWWVVLGSNTTLASDEGVSIWMYGLPYGVITKV